MLSAIAVQGLPEVSPGTDLAALIAKTPLEPGDVLVIAHKIVSKSEGRIRRLADVQPSERAAELLRAERGVLICVTHHGFVCANAGVDASNAPGDSLILLPSDPDASARRLRDELHALTGVAPGVLITDSFGRAWRHGQADVAIGCAGIRPLEDWRGSTDASGRELSATWIAIADELAAAADLVRAKDSSEPVVLIRGAGRHVGREHGPGAAALLRPASEDLFR